MTDLFAVGGVGRLLAALNRTPDETNSDLSIVSLAPCNGDRTQRLPLLAEAGGLLPSFVRVRRLGDHVVLRLLHRIITARYPLRRAQ